ncbi:MAG: hypothetical protein A4E55_00219 [Pelotomaculum sp. PtaU1.Bin035]|nr:MAG: hypothetical protein A4E55_00219 [Pelotomaculum sp. PtaU1.Bin035]
MNTNNDTHLNASDDQNTDQSAVEILEPLEPVREGHPAWNRLPDELREEIAMFIAQGGTLKDAAAKFGINRTTAGHIYREYFNENKELENMRLGHKFHNLAERVVDELNSKDLTSVPASQLGVLAGIAVDKKTQLVGRPTAAPGQLNLRVTWKDGTGAVEFSTKREE